MNTKDFSVLLVFVLVVGRGLGGAFAGGVALGKSQADDIEVRGSSAPLPFSPLQAPSGQSGQQATDQVRQQFGSCQVSQEDREQLRQRFQSGEINPEDLDRLRQQFAGQFGQGFPGGGELTGIIEKVEGNTLTVDTPQGTRQATFNNETVVQKFAAGDPEDLQAGVRVTLIGQPGEDGIVEARSILITPTGADGFGGGFFGGRQQLGQESP
jgi:hypothetical protein